VKIWQAATGQELHTLKGHTNVVQSVAFSPDGQRLASAGDQTLRIWDITGGQELCTLKGDTPVHDVAFSPDGLLLASAGGDNTVKVWDARPLTPELAIERAALGLLEFFCPRSPRQADLVESIRSNRTISEPVRQKALALLETYWHNHVGHQGPPAAPMSGR
jgi:WD40 repeat protein